MPIAINISYGTNEGAHNGSSLFETYLDSAAQRWKNVICVAAGNERARGITTGDYQSGTKASN